MGMRDFFKGRMKDKDRAFQDEAPVEEKPKDEWDALLDGEYRPVTEEEAIPEAVPIPETAPAFNLPDIISDLELVDRTGRIPDESIRAIRARLGEIVSSMAAAETPSRDTRALDHSLGEIAQYLDNAIQNGHESRAWDILEEISSGVSNIRNRCKRLSDSEWVDSVQRLDQTSNLVHMYTMYDTVEDRIRERRAELDTLSVEFDGLRNEIQLIRQERPDIFAEAQKPVHEVNAAIASEVVTLREKMRRLFGLDKQIKNITTSITQEQNNAETLNESIAQCQAILQTRVVLDNSLVEKMQAFQEEFQRQLSEIRVNDEDLDQACRSAESTMEAFLADPYWRRRSIRRAREIDRILGSFEVHSSTRQQETPQEATNEEPKKVYNA